MSINITHSALSFRQITQDTVQKVTLDLVISLGTPEECRSTIYAEVRGPNNSKWRIGVGWGYKYQIRSTKDFRFVYANIVIVPQYTKLVSLTNLRKFVADLNTIGFNILIGRWNEAINLTENEVIPLNLTSFSSIRLRAYDANIDGIRVWSLCSHD